MPGLDDVGIDGALHQESRPCPSLCDSSSNVRMNSSPMILRFCFRVGHARQLRQEPLLRPHVHERHVEVPAEGVFHLFGLVLAHQAVVDEDAGQLVAHRLVDQERGHRRIHSPGQAADHVLLAHLLPDARHGLFDDGGRRPGGRDVADLVEEVLEDVLAVVGVSHLGMELHPVEPCAAGPPWRRPACWGWSAVMVKPGGTCTHGVAVAHPAGQLRGKPGEKSARARLWRASCPRTPLGPTRATRPPFNLAMSCSP